MPCTVLTGVASLVTRPTFGSSAFNGVFALTAADVALRRDVAFDLALPFLGVVLLGFPGLRDGEGRQG